ncbi:MAG: hypothetical protein ABIA93_03045 [Candidatus Woesearchaeota archaeon]
MVLKAGDILSSGTLMDFNGVPVLAMVLDKEKFVPLYLEQRLASGWPVGEKVELENLYKWGNLPSINLRTSEIDKGSRTGDDVRFAEQTLFMNDARYAGVYVLGRPLSPRFDRRLGFEVLSNAAPATMRTPKDLAGIADGLSIAASQSRVDHCFEGQIYEVRLVGSYLAGTLDESIKGQAGAIELIPLLERMGFHEGQFK